MDNVVLIARKVKNKGKVHVFCGDPMSDGCDKTVIESGNNFSPGVWTCGISVWIGNGGRLYSPDIIQDNEIQWRFSEGIGLPPIIESSYNAGEGLKVRNRLAHIGKQGSEAVDFVRVEVVATQILNSCLYLVVRDIGPAGAKIDSIKWDERNNYIIVNNGIIISPQKVPDECSILYPDDEFDSPLAVLKYNMIFDNNMFALDIKVAHGFKNQPMAYHSNKINDDFSLSVEEGFTRCKESWVKAFSARVFAPDERIQKVWEQCIFHILSAMECGLPRTGAVNYPVFWIRDCVIILRALDLIGRQDLARKGNDYLSSLYFGGGFGAEADAPGEGIWSLVTHAKMTRDIEWLRSVFFYIEKRVDLICKMLSAKELIRVPSESRTPNCVDWMCSNILCFPSENGTINGRMDFHSPNFYINCWSLCGLKLASEAAIMIGENEKSREWEKLASKLEDAIVNYLLPQYGNERDSIVTPYPTKTLYRYEKELRDCFIKWYTNNRLTRDGKRKAEKFWPYFEIAQIHNAILLDFKKEAWICLDDLLNTNKIGDIYVFCEGEAGGNECLPFKNGYKARGWLSSQAYGGNMPHNWANSEMINLIRDIFIVEEDGFLVLGKGVPEQWLKLGSHFGIENMPTEFGNVSYTVYVEDNGKINLKRYEGPDKYKIAFE